jgi:hypothetical protein
MQLPRSLFGHCRACAGGGQLLHRGEQHRGQLFRPALSSGRHLGTTTTLRKHQTVEAAEAELRRMTFFV